MKDRLERLVFLPFTAGCISDSSIPVVPFQHSKRSKQGTNAASPDERKDIREGYLVDEESLSGQNWKSTLPRFQKLFKNLSHIFVYKDELEPEMTMEIGLPTDVKHVTHIGLDGCTSSIFSKGWDDLAEEDLIDLHSLPLSELDLAIKQAAKTSKIPTFLETKYHSNSNLIAQ